jgi:hypothetical protein
LQNQQTGAAQTYVGDVGDSIIGIHTLRPLSPRAAPEPGRGRGPAQRNGRLIGKGKTTFKRTRFLLLKNPWNLRTDERLSTLVRWNTPIVRAYYLKEAFQLFWDYRQPARAEQHLRRWMHSA